MKVVSPQMRASQVTQ